MEILETSLSHTFAILNDLTIVWVFVWYFYGFLTAWVGFTFLRGLGGMEVSLDDFTSALIWPLVLVSFAGLMIRGLLLTYKEYKEKDGK